MNNPYIEITNVTKVFKDTTVLSNINLKLDKGKIYGFRGKNGSGKTMLFRAICGLIRLTEGEIRVDGKIIGKDVSFPSNTGILIEYPGFLNNYTGFRNLKFLADINKKITDEEIKESIKKVGLDPDDKRKFKKYSLGMKQRLGIAQAIMENPDLIILDEPTNALDRNGVELVNNIILDLKKKNKTVLVASHDKETLEAVADEIYVIENGEIVDNAVIKG